MVFLVFALFTQSATALVPAENKLQIAQQVATQDLSRLQAELAQARALSPCDHAKLKMQFDYAQWFLKHYADFEKERNTVDLIASRVEWKLKDLKPFKTETTPITFAATIQYFKSLNQQYDALAGVEKQSWINKTYSSKAFKQMIAAISKFSFQLNASAVDGVPNYRMDQELSAKGFELSVTVQEQADQDGIRRSYQYPLTKAVVSKNFVDLNLNEQEKWTILSRANVRVSKLLPIDGFIRYGNFQYWVKETCGKEIRIPQIPVGGPYLSFDDFNKTLQQLIDDGAFKGDQSMEFALINHGKYYMGSPATELGRGKHETRHKVTLTHSFQIQTTEVTQKQWYDLTKTNPSQFKNQKDCPNTYTPKFGGMCPNNPVENVSWFDAVRFANAVSIQANLEPCYDLKQNFNTEVLTAKFFECEGYRLPTEAEWEYAVRTTQRNPSYTPYYFGEDVSLLPKKAWFSLNAKKHTHEVATRSATAIGLYDMSGNVEEWVQDWYDHHFQTDKDQVDPTGVSPMEKRITRGGAWSHDANELRSANRRAQTPDTKKASVGFRLVRTIFED